MATAIVDVSILIIALALLVELMNLSQLTEIRRPYHQMYKVL